MCKMCFLVFFTQKITPDINNMEILKRASHMFYITNNFYGNYFFSPEIDYITYNLVKIILLYIITLYIKTYLHLTPKSYITYLIMKNITVLSARNAQYTTYNWYRILKTCHILTHYKWCCFSFVIFFSLYRYFVLQYSTVLIIHITLVFLHFIKNHWVRLILKDVTQSVYYL